MLDQCPGALYHRAQDQAVIGQLHSSRTTIIRNRSGQRPRGSPVAQLDRSTDQNRRRPAEGIGARQGQHRRPGLLQSGAADQVGYGLIIGPVKGQGAAGSDAEVKNCRDPARPIVIAQLQGAGTDVRDAGIGVDGAQTQGAATGLGKAAAAADDAGKGDRIGSVKSQGPTVGHCLR